MNLPVPAGVDATGYRLGPPQRAGALTMVPVFGPSYPGVAPPRSGLKLSRVVTYGQVELTNPAASGVAIVPLHVGYIQDSAQNHALCRSAFIAAGQTLRFDDACCVQASQGGYLSERDQWFFILPVELRAAALRLRGTSQYSKLWDDIADFNARHGLPARGHLEQVLTRKRAVLTQYQSRLEPLDGQLGALFFVGDSLAGVEIAPVSGVLRRDLDGPGLLRLRPGRLVRRTRSWPGPVRGARGGFRRRRAGRAAAAPALGGRRGGRLAGARRVAAGRPGRGGTVPRPATVHGGRRGRRRPGGHRRLPAGVRVAVRHGGLKTGCRPDPDPVD